MSSRRFELHRYEDPTGNSGVGIVAEGCQFTNGLVAITWKTEHRGMEVWDSLHSPKHLHGHDGKTKVVWVDPPEPSDEELMKENDEETS